MSSARGLADSSVGGRVGSPLTSGPSLSPTSHMCTCVHCLPVGRATGGYYNWWPGKGGGGGGGGCMVGVPSR